MAEIFKWKPRLRELEQLIREGKTRAQLADHFGVSENSLATAIRRYGLNGLSPNDSSTGGASSRTRIDWAPLMPKLLTLMEQEWAASEIAKRLGVSTVALSAAMERQSSAEAGSVFCPVRLAAALRLTPRCPPRSTSPV